MIAAPLSLFTIFFDALMALGVLVFLFVFCGVLLQRVVTPSPSDEAQR